MSDIKFSTRIDTSWFGPPIAAFGSLAETSALSGAEDKEALAPVEAQAQEPLSDLDLEILGLAGVDLDNFDFANHNLDEFNLQTPMEAYEEQRKHEELIDALEKEKRELRSEISGLRSNGANKDREIADKDHQVKTLSNSNQALELQAKDYKRQYEDQVDATKAIHDDLDKVHGDLQAAEKATRTILQQRDRALGEYEETVLQLHSLREQWQGEHDRVQDLERTAEAVDGLQKQIEGLDEDVDQMRSALNEKERTILVKDARISYIEQQLQKALEGQLSAAAAAEATAAATASVTDVPTTINNGMESLEEQLANAGEDFSNAGDDEDYDMFDGEDSNLDFSYIAETINMAPAEPVALQLTRSAIETIDTAPIEPTTLSLDHSVIQTVGTTPVEPTKSQLTQSTINAANTAPVEPLVPKLERSTLKTTDTTPIEQSARKLEFSSIETTDTTPIQPLAPSLAFSGMKTVDTAPVESTAGKLEFSAIKTTDTIPSEPLAPSLTFSNIKTVDNAPVEQTASSLDFSAIETVNTTPNEPLMLALDISSIKAVGTAPVKPLTIASDLSAIKTVGTTPVEPATRSLSFSTLEVVGTSPTKAAVRQSAMSNITAVDIAPSNPPQLRSSSMQTEPAPTSALANITSIDTTPSDPPEPTSSSMQFSTMSTVGTSPIESLVNAMPPPLGLSTISSVGNLPTPRHRGVLISNRAKQSMSVISTSVSQRPVQSSAKPKPTTSSSAVQTDDLPPIVREVQVPVSPTAPDVSRTLSFTEKFGWLFMLVTMLGFLTSILAADPQASYITARGRAGAYGYPAHFLGIIPIGHSIGNTPFSEFIAKHSAITLQALEAWAGVDRTLPY